jgi:hypothetical protein
VEGGLDGLVTPLADAVVPPVVGPRLGDGPRAEPELETTAQQLEAIAPAIELVS